MNKYQEAKIYAIKSHLTDKIYIGSTIKKLNYRMNTHKHWSNTCSSKEIINHGDAYIELIELYPCNNKEELHKREEEVMKQYINNLVNKQMIKTTKYNLKYNLKNI